MLKPKISNQFEKDLKLMQKQNKDLSKFKAIFKTLLEEEQPEQKHKDHKLKGNYAGYRECHIEPDWLLIYRVNGDLLELARTGSHTELFKM